MKLPDRPTDRDPEPIGTYECLSFRFEAVASKSAKAVGSAFARVYASCASASDQVDHDRSRLEITERGEGYVVQVGGEPEVHAESCEAALIAAMTEIDRATVASTAESLLLMHASAVVFADGPFLFVGASGAGKSTLAAALVGSGRPYAGDEVLALDPAATSLFANPKPFKLDGRSRRALHRLLGAGGERRGDVEGRCAQERLVAPHDLGPVVASRAVEAPVAVVHVEFRPGATASVSPLSRGEVAEVLAGQCFNFAMWGGRALDAVAELARRAPGVRLVFGELEGALFALDGFAS